MGLTAFVKLDRIKILQYTNNIINFIREKKKMKRNKIFAVLCGAMMLCTTAFVSCGDEEEKRGQGRFKICG